MGNRPVLSSRPSPLIMPCTKRATHQSGNCQSDVHCWHMLGACTSVPNPWKAPINTVRVPVRSMEAHMQACTSLQPQLCPICRFRVTSPVSACGPGRRGCRWHTPANHTKQPTATCYDVDTEQCRMRDTQACVQDKGKEFVTDCVKCSLPECSFMTNVSTHHHKQRVS